MRKNLLMMAVILLTALMANAETSQTVTATLNHDGNATIFIGGNGMRDALNAAVDGDAIILSPGTFNAVNITKAVTLRGAGAPMLTVPGDTIKPIDGTYISGDMSINIETTEGKLSIEGCQFNNKVSFIKAPATDVFKTRIAEVPRLSKDVASINFTHCMVFFNDGRTSDQLNDLNQHTSMLNTAAFFGYFFNPFINATNCLITGDRSQTFNYFSSAAGGGQLINCIILFPYNSGYYYSLSANCVAYNCVACTKKSFNNYNSSESKIENFFQYSYNGTNQAFHNLTLFNDEDVVPSYPFTLTEEAAAKYLGNDGTQVGIHGGALPMDPIPDNLLVTRCNIAPKTTPAGKLSIEIQVSTAK